MPVGDATMSVPAPGTLAVSVLIPTYNRAPYLGAAIESVLAQTFDDLELIVIDDGSTDDTSRVLARFRDPRLRVLGQANRGVRAALTAGLRVARGRYIARNDSDDLWLPDHLATIVPVLEADPGLGFAYGRAEFIDAQGSPLPGGRGAPLRYPDDPFRSLLHTDYTCAVTSVMRRAAIDETGSWGESRTTSEDWEMALRIARDHRVQFVDRVVARIRLHGGNTIAAPTHPARALSDRLRIVETVLSDPGTPAEIAALAPRCHREVYIGTALQLVDLGQHGEALRAFRAAVRVGGNPLGTGARIVWRVFSWTVVARHAWSRALARRLVERRRHLGRRTGPHAGAVP